MSFTQTMHVQASSAEPLTGLIEEWHRDQAGVAPGYQRARVLADAEEDGRYVIEVDFTDQRAATRNNDRPETQAWAEKLREVATDAPEYHSYEVAFATT